MIPTKVHWRADWPSNHTFDGLNFGRIGINIQKQLNNPHGFLHVARSFSFSPSQLLQKKQNPPSNQALTKKNLRSPPLKAWRYQALQLDPCFENCSVVFRHSVSASWNGLAQGDLNPLVGEARWPVTVEPFNGGPIRIWDVRVLRLELNLYLSPPKYRSKLDRIHQNPFECNDPCKQTKRVSCWEDIRNEVACVL